MTNEFIERNTRLTIERKEISDGFFKLVGGDITTENGGHCSLSANDIVNLMKIFSAAEDKGLCI